MWPATLVRQPPRLSDAFSPVEAGVLARLITRMMHDGVVIQDTSGAIVYCNDKSAELMHLTPEQFIGGSSVMTEREFTTLDGDPWPGERHPSMQAMSSGEQVHGEVIGVHSPTASTRWLSVDSSPVDLPSGRYAVTVFTDITDALEWHRQLRRTHAEIQNQLIQRELPSSDRVRFRADYRSSGVSRGVGGDFYGVNVRRPDSFGVFIGDVCGHGIRSAGLSATARNTVRALSRVLDDPSEVIEHLHDVVSDERPDSFLTAAYGRLDLMSSDGDARFHVVCAGHPQPLLVRNEIAVPIGVTGALVGMVPNSARPVHEVRLLPGDRVVMHTDGILDDAVPRITSDELAERMPADESLEDIVNWMMDLAAERQQVSTGGVDDAAVLAFEIL